MLCACVVYYYDFAASAIMCAVKVPEFSLLHLSTCNSASILLKDIGTHQNMNIGLLVRFTGGFFSKEGSNI